MALAGALMVAAGAVPRTAPGGRDAGARDARALEALTEQASEYQVKAAFLYNIARFVSWPEEVFEGQDARFVFAVVGQDPFDEHLDRALADRKIGERAVSVVRHADPKGIRRCQILFVPATEMKHLPKVLAAVKGEPVLLIGEADGFARKGGAVNFYIAKKNVRFEINPAETKRRGLSVSSRLLKLARVIEEERE